MKKLSLTFATAASVTWKFNIKDTSTDHTEGWKAINKLLNV